MAVWKEDLPLPAENTTAERGDDRMRRLHNDLLLMTASRRSRLTVMLLTPLVAGCARVVNEACGTVLQHSIGSAIGPCRTAMDSVALNRGEPWRRYRSDESDRDIIRFWYEWAYPPRDASGTPVADTVDVVGFLWEGGGDACRIVSRRAKRPGPRGLPWSAAGTVPPG